MMNGQNGVLQRLRSLSAGPAGRLVVAGVTVAAIVVIVGAVDGRELARASRQAADEPAVVLVALLAFAAAFGLRAVAWRRVLPGLSFGHALAAIHLALGANHVLPLRLGEPFRVLSVTRRAGVPLDAAAASTVTLRAADVVAVVMVGLLIAPAAFVDLIGPVGWGLLVLVAAVLVLGWRWMVSVVARRPDVRLPDPVTFLLAASAWLAESVLVWRAAGWAGLEISWSDAVLVTTVAVAAQIAAIAPGGFGTYEAAAVAAYVVLGHDQDQALVAALLAHGLKTAYSLLVGLVALLYPAPGFLGRFRLAASGRAADPITADPVTVAESAVSDAPIVLFMPAYNEERSVGSCIRRAPESVCGHPVQVLVIDDGSTDGTVVEATAAGAEVLSLPSNQGLGAAVRIGLAEGVSRNAAAVAFCDADGEYPPEELANLVTPILDGRADYVGGSRFLGRIDHMRLHRRLGNLLLTRLLSMVARRRITDGQTGYRAFSPRAAADAEVVHDFNYAQVLTLDLLGKGYRYLEVPISYHFRTEGESFIRLGQYLRNVVPAVYRELNAG